MSVRKRLFSLVLALHGLVSVWTPAWAAAADAPPSSLTVVIAAGHAPFGFGAQTGYLRELWEIWAQRTGVTVNFQFMEWQAGAEAVLKGQADVLGAMPAEAVVPGLAASRQPMAAVSFRAYYRIGSADIGDEAALGGHEVAVIKGGGCERWLSQINGVQLRPFTSFRDVLDAVERSDADVFCTGRPNVHWALRQRDMDVEIKASPVLHVGNIVWATRVGTPALHQFIANGFATITPDERAELSARWQGSGGYEHPKKLLVHSLTYFLLMALVGMVAFATWAVLLRQKLQAQGAELRCAEARVDGLLEGLTEPAWIKDLAGRFLAVNPSLARLCKVDDPSTMLGRTAFDFFPRQMAEAYRRNDNLVLSRMQAMLVIEPYVDENGTSRWVETSKTPLTDDMGRCVGIVGISREMLTSRAASSALGQAADAVRTSEARFRSLVEALPLGVMEIDRDGTILCASEQAWSILGLGLGLGGSRRFDEPWINLIHDEDRPAVIVGLRNMQAKGELLDAEVRLATGRAASVRWVRLRGIRCVETEGMCLILQDVSDRRLLEDRLSAREAEFCHLAERLPEALERAHGAPRRESSGSLPGSLPGSLYDAIRAAATD